MVIELATMVIELEDRIVYCPSCHGAGAVWYSGMGPADNTDVWEDYDVCSNCDGDEYWGVQRVEVMG